MPFLQSIQSLFPYAGKHRALLLAAKDLQCAKSIIHFEQVYGYFAAHALKQIIASHEIEEIIIARVRLPRVAGGHWHPADFWHRCVVSLQSQSKMTRFIPIRMAVSIDGQRRALMNPEERRERLKHFLKRHPLSYFPRQTPSASHILLLDDVLTSGGALLKEWTDLIAAGHSQGDTQLHAFTLFRTPHSVVEEKDSL